MPTRKIIPAPIRTDTDTGETTHGRWPRRMKLTDGAIARLPRTLPKRMMLVRDAELKGFGLCVTAGRESFFAEARLGHLYTNRRVTLGDTDTMSARIARRHAAKMLGQMRSGIDPIREREKAQAKEVRRQAEAARKSVTLRELWQHYLTNHAADRLKASTLREYTRVIETGPYFKDWIDRPASAITRGDVKERHAKIGKKNGEAQANGAFRVLSAVFNYALEDGTGGLIENPVLVLKARRFKVVPRSGRVPDNQLGRFTNALEDVATSTRPDASEDEAKTVPEGLKVAADFALLILLTGLRKNEAARLRWSDVDTDGGTFTITDTKNGRKLVLPITEGIESILVRRRDVADAHGSPFVFPSIGTRTSEAGCIREPRHVLRAVEKTTGVNVTVHDLRRTFASVAASVVPFAALKTLLNHAGRAADVTLDVYIHLGPDDLRPHLQAIHEVIRTRQAAARGLRIAQTA